ncbi:MAG: PAS domain S-box protein [Flavitalea sp.]
MLHTTDPFFIANDPTDLEQMSYRILVENVREYAIFMIDLFGIVISWNKGAEQIKGYTAAEIIGKHISIFYTPEQIAQHLPELNLAKAKTIKRFKDEGWRVRKNGSIFWAEIIFTAIHNTSGQLIGYSKVTRDQTKDKNSEAQIQHLNKQLELQLQKSELEMLEYKHAIDESSIVAITDQKGIIKYVNDNFCKVSKFDREELMGQDHRIINSGYHSKKFIRDIWTTIANGNIWRGEIKNKAKDGTYYWVDTTIVPFMNEQHKPYQYLAIRSDITLRKNAEQEIIEINNDLEIKITQRTFELTAALEREKELGEMKSHFVSMASHEFRTPFGTIMSSVSLLDHYTDAAQAEKRAKHIDRIKSSVKNLTEILNDFLSLQKMEEKKYEVKNTRFKITDLLNEVTTEMEGILKRKKQFIEFKIEGLAEICQDQKILHNILLNLLSNAIKYSADDKTIRISAKADEKKIVIAVSDEGMGIPAAAQKHLFTRFFRAANVSNIQGTGLGLNIVKNYAELLEGQIHFVSEEYKGSTFTIECPHQEMGDTL